MDYLYWLCKMLNIRYLNIVFLVSSLLFWGCGSQSSSSGNYASQGVSDDEEEIIEEEVFSLPKITNKNVKKVLGDFAEKNPETLVLMSTRLGDMKIKLYEGTPYHRANFLQLVKRGYYEGTVFHRVVKDLIIQGGNLDDPMIKRKKNEVGFYRVPAEFNVAQYFHKKGVLASPRRDEENPQKMSNPFEFYIVQGTPLQAAVVQALGQQNSINYTPAQVQTYATLGGLPHLDGKYTVFGEVIEGLEVIDSIASVEVDKSDDWPFEDVEISVKVIEE